MTSIWIITMAAIATILTRFCVLWFPPTWKQSAFLQHLSTYLPVASFGLLVVYSVSGSSMSDIKDLSILILSLVLIVLIQLWKDNVLLSIFISSFVYIFLINII